MCLSVFKEMHVKMIKIHECISLREYTNGTMQRQKQNVCITIYILHSVFIFIADGKLPKKNLALKADNFKTKIEENIYHLYIHQHLTITEIKNSRNLL